jgi:hypothetical protein
MRHFKIHLIKINLIIQKINKTIIYNKKISILYL